MLNTDQKENLQLPKGFDNFEKFERKALKLREHIELELEERKQVDDVINFFVTKNKGGVDFLNDDQFYQPNAKIDPNKASAAINQKSL